MAWIESHQTLLTHRKTSRASRALNISKITVIGHLHALWWWCLDNVQDGELSSVDIEDFADGACWEGDPDYFISGLVAAGFLDRDEKGLRVHDWHFYAGRLIEKRIANTERMREKRAAAVAAKEAEEVFARAELVRRTCVARAGTVQCTCDACAGATVQYSTVPNSTVQYPTEQYNTNTESIAETPLPQKAIPSRADTGKALQLIAFAEFYASYPVKKAKQDAERAWLKIAPSETLRTLIMAGLATAKSSQEWSDDGGKYIPHPATFLNHCRWEDTYRPVGSRAAAVLLTANGTVHPNTMQGVIDDTARAIRAEEARQEATRQNALMLTADRKGLFQ